MRKNIVGQKFGLLTVMSFSRIVSGRTRWNCECVCGKSIEVYSSNLRRGQQSCGCAKWGNPRLLIGKQFNYLTVIGLAQKAKNNKIRLHCRCECGKHTMPERRRLLNNEVKSCGCKQKLTIKHGAARFRMSTKTYRTWMNMKFRCYNKNNKSYDNYGGRGITVCSRWLKAFENFLADMGEPPTPSHSIERKNNNGNYDPDNCMWATPIQQARNTRRNHVVECRGEKNIVSAWAEQSHIKASLIYARLKAGWHPERAIFSPPTFRGQHARNI